MNMRKPKDRDFLLTDDGLLFCVVGYLHPPDMVTAYVKYAPVPGGLWQRGGVTYGRMLARYNLDSVRDTLHFLQENFPHYMHYCRVRDMVFSMVPLDRVAEYYAPEVRLAEIVAAPQDPLEEEAAALATRLAQAAGIPVTALGVTGSLLPGIHNPAFSDIDLTVYGADNSWRVRHFLRGLKSRVGAEARPSGSPIRALTPEEVADRQAGILKIHPTLTPEMAQYLAERRWNFLRFGERFFSVHATRTDTEITETYGDYVYRGRGIARVLAQVVDVSEALFSPAIYRVNRVRATTERATTEDRPYDGEVADIREVVSFDRIFADAVDEGAEIEVWGKVEQVVSAPRQAQPAAEYKRLVIGTAVLPDGGWLIPRIHPHPSPLPPGEGS
jgi:predicted nucleotidyltransferase